MISSALNLLVFAYAIPAQTGAIRSMTGNVNERVLNVPYSARRHFTSVEKRADGKTSRSESGGSEARDSRGRTYSAGERHWTYLENGKSVLKSEMLYRIQDPVSNTNTSWDSTSKQVKVIHWPQGPQDSPVDVSAFLAPIPGTEEDLGSKTIEGVAAEGKRNTYTVAEGNDQHSRPLRVVHESWYCPELKIVVLETNDDPRSGTWRNELVKIVRGEPDVTKYRPPANYVVNHVRMPAANAR
jgi:hypothetical protein